MGTWESDTGGSASSICLEGIQTAKPASPLDQVLYADTRIWLPDDLLLKADKMTMANSIELGVPFLDLQMVEYAATLSETSKLGKGIGKVLLRQDMTGDLPPAILNRSKKGFPVPIGP